MNKPPQAIAGVLFMAGGDGVGLPTPLPVRQHAGHKEWGVTASTGDWQNAPTFARKRVAGPERHVEEATLSASGPTALRSSGVAADLRWAVGNSGTWDFSQVRLQLTLVATHQKTKQNKRKWLGNHLLIITNNPNAADFSELASSGVENDPVSAFPLSPIEGHVGALNQALGRVGQAFPDRHADGDGD